MLQKALCNPFKFYVKETSSFILSYVPNKLPMWQFFWVETIYVPRINYKSYVIIKHPSDS